MALPQKAQDQGLPKVAFSLVGRVIIKDLLAENVFEMPLDK
jgi:hypothetical protein